MLFAPDVIIDGEPVTVDGGIYYDRITIIDALDAFGDEVADSDEYIDLFRARLVPFSQSRREFPEHIAGDALHTREISFIEVPDIPHRGITEAHVHSAFGFTQAFRCAMRRREYKIDVADTEVCKRRRHKREKHAMFAPQEFREPVKEAGPYAVEVYQVAHNFGAVDGGVDRRIREEFREQGDASLTAADAEQPVMGKSYICVFEIFCAHRVLPTTPQGQSHEVDHEEYYADKEHTRAYSG